MSRYELHPVPAELATYVSAIWTLDATGPAWEENVWPSLQSDIVFGTTSYQTQFDQHRQCVNEACVQGVTLHPRLYRHGVDRLTGVQFRPGALAAVIGDVTAAREVLLPVAQRGEFDDPAPTVRASAAANWVRDHITEPVRTHSLLRQLTRHASTAAAADALGVTSRTLHRHTRRAFGFSPKEVQRICRFRSTLPALRQGLPYAEVALAAGYYDQAHFCREFSTFTRTTPSQAFPRPC